MLGKKHSVEKKIPPKNVPLYKWDSQTVENKFETERCGL